MIWSRDAVKPNIIPELRTAGSIQIVNYKPNIKDDEACDP